MLIKDVDSRKPTALMGQRSRNIPRAEVTSQAAAGRDAQARLVCLPLSLFLVLPSVLSIVAGTSTLRQRGAAK